MLQAALLGGVLIGVLSALPIINIANCCCVWILGGGMLAAYLAQQASPRPVSPGQGALLGFIAGAIGALVWLIAFAAIDFVIGPFEQRMVAVMLDRSVEMPPDVRQMLETIGERSSSPLRYVFGFLFQLFAGVIFASLGGLLGALLFKKDQGTGNAGQGEGLSQVTDNTP